MKDKVIAQNFFLEVRDDECIILQSALTAKLHRIHQVIMDPETSDTMREIHRVNFTKLNAIRQKLLEAFKDPLMRI